MATEHDMILRLEFSDDCARSDIEDRLVDILEVIEEHGSHLALGVVGSASFDPPVIELDFDVLADSQTELFQRLTDIVEVIERHATLKRVVSTSTHERELTPA